MASDFLPDGTWSGGKELESLDLLTEDGVHTIPFVNHTTDCVTPVTYL